MEGTQMPAMRMLTNRMLNCRMLSDRMQAMTVWRHVAAAIGSVVFLGVMNTILNVNYTASNHPVPYAEGQTTFSGSEIKGFYAVMQDAGTLDRYVITQLIDFGFIAAMIVLGVSVGSLLSRLNREGSLFERAGRFASLMIVIGAMFDVVENLISFVLLASPQGFPDWLAIVYSLAAVIKFGCIGIGMVAVLVSLVGLGFGRSQRVRSSAC